jgi:hypothetical protein
MKYKLKEEQMQGIRRFMLLKICFNVNYYIKDQSLDSTSQQSEQLLHTLVKHG